MTPQKKALVIGIGGQDASFLADLLLEKGYAVSGVHRRTSTGNLSRIAHLLDNPSLALHQGDLSDPGSIHRIIADVQPHEIYNEADQDHVGWSYSTPAYSWDVTAGAVGRLLESVRQLYPLTTKVFQPVSATMFGCSPGPQHEHTPFKPQSPYAVAKTAAFLMCQHYRREHGMFVSTAIFFNHDSVRREGDYLLHKICKAAVLIAAGKQDVLRLGNLDMRVDIGYAPEYMLAAWQMMQLNYPDDFVIASGWPEHIEAIVAFAFQEVELDWRNHVQVDKAFTRPGPQPELIGLPTKARQAFGFQTHVGVADLVKMLLDKYRKELVP